MAKCSFGKVSLKSTFHEIWPYGTELYARLFYVCTDSTEILLAAMDTLETFPKEAEHFCRIVSAQTGIPSDHIWYHELQIHAAPNSPHLTGTVMETIALKISKEVLQMKERAEDFTCEVSEAYAGNKFSINREQYIPGLGGVTVWAGMKFDDNGLPYMDDPSRMLLQGYEPDLPALKEPIPFDCNVDPLAYLFVFYSSNGTIIGSISRFAAHPDVAVLFESHGITEGYHYHFDWPGYLSEKLETILNAPSMYLNGPCGNLATKKIFAGTDTYEKSDAEAKRIGEDLADFLLEHYRKNHISLGDPNRLKAARFSFEIPLREDFPRCLSEIENNTEQVQAAQTALQAAISNHAPAYEVKQLIDKNWRAAMLPCFVHTSCGFDEETLSRHTVKVSVSVMEFGDYLFFGVPGESLVEMTEWLRSTYTGRKTIPLDQVNGYYAYLATPTSLKLGGYTYWYSWTGRNSVPKLQTDIQKAMEQFLK